MSSIPPEWTQRLQRMADQLRLPYEDIKVEYLKIVRQRNYLRRTDDDPWRWSWQRLRFRRGV